MAAYLYSGAKVGIKQLGKKPLVLIISYPVDKKPASSGERRIRPQGKRRYRPGQTGSRPRQAVLQAGKASPKRADCSKVAAQHAVQHACCKCVAGSDPVYYPGQHDLFGLCGSVAGVDPRREAMLVGLLDVARGRSDR